MDQPVKTIVPVWLLNTKSWWLGAFPGILAFIDYVFQNIDGEQAVPFANALAILFSAIGLDLTGPEITDFIRGIAPLYLPAMIMWQRRGINQPYVATPGKADTIAQVVLDGKSAFEAGKAVGKALKQ